MMMENEGKYDALRLDNQLCFPLYASARLVTKAYLPILANYGLTYLQYLVLMVLWENDRICVKDLGSKLFLDSGTLTPVLKKMQQSGFIERVRSKEDERIVLNQLTDSGWALQDKLLFLPGELLCRSKLQHSELVQIMAAMKSLLGRLEVM